MMNSDTQYYKQVIDEYILSYLDETTGDNPHGASLMEAVKYAYNTGGKRIRPIIMLMIGDLLNVDRSKLLPYAAALEMVHSYSLIHDDLPAMDDDDERRGQPTVHVKFDEALAILAGDYLLNSASELLLEHLVDTGAADLRAFKYLLYSSGIGGMLGGQVMDIADEVNMEMSKLKQMYELKTGALFMAASTIPGLVAGLDDADVNSLTELGKTIGLTFQLVDDVLDREEDRIINKVTLVSALDDRETEALIDEYYNKSKVLLNDLNLANSNLEELIDSLVHRSV